MFVASQNKGLNCQDEAKKNGTGAILDDSCGRFAPFQM